MARKKIDEKIRQKVMQAYSKGISKRKIAAEFGISRSSVGRIVNEKSSPSGQKETIETKGKTGRQKRIEAIEKRIAELENKILEIDAKKRSKCS